MQCRTISSQTAMVCRPTPHASCSYSSFVGTTMPKTHLRIAARQPTRNLTVMGLFGLGAPELAVIAGVVALIYGPAKLPELGKGLGKTFKSFKSAANEFEKELKDAVAEDEPKKEEKRDDEKK